MALLWIEGFESFGTSNGVAPSGLDAKYPLTNQTAFMDVEAGRVAGKSLEMEGGSAYIQTPDLGSQTTIVMGFGFKYAAVGTAKFLSFYEPASVEGLNFRITAAGEIQAYRLSTLLGTSSAGAVTAGVWRFIEIKATINDTTGSVEVKVAGSTILNLTSQDTKQGSTAEWAGFRLVSGGGTGQFVFDDWYILDTSGAQNNDFIGNHRVDLVQPDSAGDSAQYTPSAGSNYQNVDENPKDDDTTYNENATTGNKDLFNYGAMPSIGTISGLQVNTVCRETDASTFSLKTLIKTGTTESADTAQTIGTTTYVNLYRVSELDPDTSSAWTESGVNGAQFGYETG